MGKVFQNIEEKASLEVVTLRTITTSRRASEDMLLEPYKPGCKGQTLSELDYKHKIWKYSFFNYSLATELKMRTVVKKNNQLN